MRTVLTPITSPPKTYDIIAMDTEGTGDPDGFVLAAVWTREGGEVIKSRRALRSYLFSRRTTDKLIVCANLEYDYTVALQPYPHNLDIIMSGGRWVAANYHDNHRHTWRAMDIQRVAPLSVAEMGRVVGIAKYPTPPSLTGRPSADVSEWYCDTHRRLWCVDCYCVQDARITYEFTALLQSTLNQLGGELRATAASTALDAYRRRYLDEEIPTTSPEHNEMLRSAYYGGRVETYRVGTVYDVNRYDINSLYPSVMRDMYAARPDTYRRADNPRAWHRYLDTSGVIACTITVPDSHIGVVPYRRDGRLYFPTGRLQGVWTLAEARHALDYGCKITNVKWVLHATRTIMPFKRWVNDLWDLRLQWKREGDKREVVAKLLMNSLSGKFGQRIDGSLAKLQLVRPDKSLSHYRGVQMGIIAGNEYAMIPINTSVQPAYINVGWIADITSYGRNRLYDYLVSQGDNLVYCDTDSVHTYGTITPVDGLGGIKHEGIYRRATYIAPKEYGGVDNNGIAYHRVKGVPPAYREDYLRNGHVIFRQPTHTRTAMLYGGRVAVWETRTRTRRITHGNRWHDPIADYNDNAIPTYPYAAEELPDG